MKTCTGTLCELMGHVFQQHRNFAFLQTCAVMFLIIIGSMVWPVTGDEEVHSSEVVKDTNGEDVGPRITLSSTVLRTGGVLRYECIEGSDYDNNQFSRFQPNQGKPYVFEDKEHDSEVKRRTCTIDDRYFQCTIVRGQLKWNRGMGGKYFCSAFPGNWYYVHWINPDSISASPDRDLPSQFNGGNVIAHCGMDITPTYISYEGILEVKWQFTGSATGSSLRPIKESATVSWGLTNQGANSTLTITNFNPIKHGGEYQCIGEMLRYSGEQLVSPTFKIWSKPSAKLINNKRREFKFGKYESNVRFTCEALSYPFPERIEFKLQAAIINEHTKGVSNYRKDLVSVNVERHTATFTVSNMSEVFQNDSVFECRVFRRDGEDAISQERVFLQEEDPPIELTTAAGDVTLPPYVSDRKEPTKPWVIAISIIIPIVIILAIVILLVWKRVICKMDESGDYRMGHSYDPDT